MTFSSVHQKTCSCRRWAQRRRFWTQTRIVSGMLERTKQDWWRLNLKKRV